MPGKTDAWMPLFIGDYLADTMHLTTRQHGAYLLLIMHAWRNGGDVPRDHEEQAAVARLSPKDWERDRAVVQRLFNEDANGIYSKRAREELGISTALQQQRSDAGKASAAKRQRELNGSSTDGQRKPNPSPSPSQDDSERNAPAGRSPDETPLPVAARASPGGAPTHDGQTIPIPLRRMP